MNYIIATLLLLLCSTTTLENAHGLSLQVPTAAGTSGREQALRDKAGQVWKAVAMAAPKERNDEILKATTGKIPSDLKGTYYVNGLASCQVFDRLVHPFEAHGFFKAITFPGNDNEEQDETTIRLKAKYVETPVYQLETRFKRPLFRGAMSSIADTSSFMGAILNALSPTQRETANLAVRPWANKLLVTADNCPFFRVDEDSLETLGVESFNGALAGQKMLAHTRVDPKRQRLITSSLEYDVFNQATIIRFSEFDQEGNLVSKTEHTQSPACVYHDWMITDNYYIVPSAAAVFDLSKLPDLLSGRCTATDIFAIDENAPASVLLIPRDPSKEVIEASMGDGRHGVVFHMGPCHEEEDGTVVLYPMVFQRYQFGGEMGFLLKEQKFDPIPWSVSNGGPLLEEWKVGMGSATNGKASMTSKLIHDVPSDMPTFHPNREGLSCRYMYSLCGIREEGWFPFNSIAKHDLETGSIQVWPPAASAAVQNGESWDGGTSVWSEPLFVPKSSPASEDDGYLLSTCHDSDG